MSDDSERLDDPALYYQAHVFCCTNVRPEKHPRGSCARKNSVQLRDYMKKQVKDSGLSGIRVNASGCLDRCELGCTMVIYPEGIWYTYSSEADIDEIIETHLRHGHRVKRLILETDQKNLLPGQGKS